MKSYDVVIRATIEKTITVEADSEDLACDEAHEIFDVVFDGKPERYEQDTIRINEVKD